MLSQMMVSWNNFSLLYGFYLFSFNTCFFFLSGEVYSWGMGSNMQLGMGDDDSDLWTPTKIKGKALENKLVKSVSAGGQHTVILASDTSAKAATSAKTTVPNGKAKKTTEPKKTAEPKKVAEPEEPMETDETEKDENKPEENTTEESKSEENETVGSKSDEEKKDSGDK